MNWLAYFGILAGSAFANYLLKVNPDNVKPDNHEPPTADPDRAIPIIWGTCKVQPNIFWWGDKKAREFTRDGLFQGYTYYMGVAMGICWGPIDRLVDIIFNDDSSLVRMDAHTGANEDADTIVTPPIPVEVTGNEEGIDIELESQYMFGGPAQEGGIRGLMHFYFGTEDQEKNAYLDAQVAAIDPLTTPDTTPAYKRLCYAVFGRGGLDGPNGQFYWGVTSNVKQIHFVVQRCPSGLNGDATSKIGNLFFFRGYSANAAEVLYEIYTDQWWGLKRTAADMDVASFEECADTLFAQGLGIDVQTTTATPASEVIAEIERLVDAVVYTHPTTGLITMKLLRADFDVEDLPVINSDNSHDLEFHRPTYKSLVSGVKLKWTNPEKAYTEDVVDWQNQAVFDITGEENTEEVEMLGLTDSTQASIAVANIGRALSQPAAVARFRMNRLGHDWHRGKPFLLSYPERGIDPIVMRVGEIDYGSFEDAEIEISAAQNTNNAIVYSYPPPPPTPEQEGWILEYAGAAASAFGGISSSMEGTNEYIFRGPLAATLGGIGSEMEGTNTDPPISGDLASEFGGIGSEMEGTVSGGLPAEVKVLVVAGGGSGGWVRAINAYTGGGGGAGGVRYEAAHALAPGSYPVVVGAGGAGGLDPSANNGSDSSFDTITAVGGGRGARGSDALSGYPAIAGSAGGSGGGGQANGAGGAGTAGQGNNGGGSSNLVGASGSGGGAGAVGTYTGSNDGAAGGAGVANSISGASVTYGGGGGSGAYTPSNAGGAGGAGGGGAGGGQGVAGADGTANTGGGGGGAGTNTTTARAGGSGGSGIVIIRYATAAYGTCTGGTITTDGADTIHTFTSNGTFVAVAP